MATARRTVVVSRCIIIFCEDTKEKVCRWRALTGHSADLRGREGGGVHVGDSTWGEVVVFARCEVEMPVHVFFEDRLLV